MLFRSFGPTANGDRFALFQIVDATVASTIIVVLLIAVTYTHLPWRPLLALPRETPVTAAAPAAENSETPVSPLSPVTPRPTAAPDAYADST